MAQVIPALTKGRLSKVKSAGERAVYEMCCGLGDEYLILFSFPWIYHTPTGGARDGETDFIVIHKDKGVLAVEVKGGGIRWIKESDSWYSTDRNGVEHEIKNPFKQALKSKYQFQNYLRDNPYWNRTRERPTFGHATIFPSISDTRPFVSSESPADIIAGSQNIQELDAWFTSVLSFWGKEDAPRGISKNGMYCLDKLFCSTVEVKPLLSQRLAEEELQRIKLTEEQARVLRGVDQSRRALITGGAGTGKTMLALQKAKSLADEGLKVLMLCYNKPLSEYLKDWCAVNVAERGTVEAMTYHSFCSSLIKRATLATGTDYLAIARSEAPHDDEWDVVKPLAAAFASEDCQLEYDAIIIDEGQDFKEDWWLSIEPHISSEKDWLYIFQDHNQSIYEVDSYLPSDLTPFHLYTNCRNTPFIHELAYSFVDSDRTDHSSISGQPVEYILARDQKRQSDKIYNQVQKLIDKEKVSPSMIAVLTPSVGHKDYFLLLSMRSLPGSASWSIQKTNPTGVLLDTMARFKGLESMVVICWLPDDMNPDYKDHARLLYTSFSRATSRLFVCGSENTCDLLKSHSESREEL